MEEPSMQISTILATKGSTVYTIRPDQTIREAVQLLAEKRIGAVVVVNDADRPIGIVSERDIVAAVARSEALFGQQVSSIMTTDVVVARPSDDVRAVEKTMTVRRFRHLPVMDRGELVGIVSIGDVVKATIDAYEGEIETLQTRVEKG
jgi:CBS domain-containing protein